MDMIENPMVLPEYTYKFNRIPDDVWADMESNDYDDMVFDEIMQNRE